MNEPLVVQFQNMALDDKSSIVSLLRTAKVIAGRLQLSEMTAWIDHELNGYSDTSLLPDYRVFLAELKGENPINGLIPMFVKDKKLEYKLRTVYIANPVSELAQAAGHPDATLQFRLSTEFSQRLQNKEPEFLRFPLVRVVRQHKMLSIVEQVRNRLLDWSLELVTHEITGINQTFTKQDKDRATMTTNIFNFHGTVNNAGVMGADNHDFTQQNTLQVTAGDFDALRASLESMGFAAEDVKDLKTVLDSEPVPAEPGRVMHKVYSWIGKAGERLLDAGLDKAAPLAIEAISKYLGF